MKKTPNVTEEHIGYSMMKQVLREAGGELKVGPIDQDLVDNWQMLVSWSEDEQKYTLRLTPINAPQGS